jgi:hypothetical protein
MRSKLIKLLPHLYTLSFAFAVVAMAYGQKAMTPWAY